MNSSWFNHETNASVTPTLFAFLVQISTLQVTLDLTARRSSSKPEAERTVPHDTNK